MATKKEALNWFTDKIAGDIIEGRMRDPKKVSLPEVGKMYLYVYDPKWKMKLPLYDTFPLTMPIEYYSDGFLGLNFHYLTPGSRATLLDALTEADNKYKENKKILVSYQILKSASIQFSGYQECTKRYLYSQVKSRFVEIDPRDWGYVVMQPWQKFVHKRS